MKYKQIITVFLFVIGMLCVDNTISAQTQLTPECYVTKGSDSYLIRGEKLTVSNTRDISSLPLSAGVYVIKTLYNDGTFSTNKIIK